MRESTSLDGAWRFWPDVAGTLSPLDRARPPAERELGAPRAIRVPSVWQAEFDDLRLWAGNAWYERDVDVPAAWRDRTVRLRFGAVDYWCAVWVNGVPVGSHEGGYLPFELDVTSALRAGAPNTVTVGVIDPGPAEPDAGPFPFTEIPHGKQSWYGPLGGLWQSVALEAGAPVIVRTALVHGDVARGVADVWARLAVPARGGERLSYRVESPSGVRRELEGGLLAAGQGEQRVEIEVGKPELWELEAPRLYRLTVTLSWDGRALDEWSDTFGFRTIEAKGGKIVLNGRAVYVLGVLDHDYWEGPIVHPASEHEAREQLARVRELGINTLRCHLKVPEPEYLYAADREGLLVWQELPNWTRGTDAARRRGLETLAGMVERDFNHPSIVVRTIVNESWGLNLDGDGEHRRWLAQSYDALKEMDPTRLAVDNSPVDARRHRIRSRGKKRVPLDRSDLSFHVKSDLNDDHFYAAVPDGAADWARTVSQWVDEPTASWSPHGDAERRGDEPQLVSEFGAWGLPDVKQLRGDAVRDPWWFRTGRERAAGTVCPHGTLRRFREWGLGEIFGSWEGFVAESQDHQFESLKFHIEEMRRHDRIAGYVTTMLADTHWEPTGLLDGRKRPKSFHERFREVNAEDVVIGRVERRALEAGDEGVAEVLVSHWSRHELDGAHVEWTLPELGLGGELRAGRIPVGSVARLGELRFTVPPLDGALRARLALRLLDGRGREVNRNSVTLLLLGERRPPASPGDAAVAERWDDELAAHVAAGGRALVLATDREAFPAGLSLRVARRARTKWNGNWAQGITWLRPELTVGLALGPRVDLAFAGLAPEHVVRGYGAEARSDVLAALYVGWIRATVATIAAFRHGAGAAVVCTLPLGGANASHPVAARLLDRLLALAAAPDLAPRTELRPTNSQSSRRRRAARATGSSAGRASRPSSPGAPP